MMELIFCYKEFAFLLALVLLCCQLWGQWRVGFVVVIILIMGTSESESFSCHNCKKSLRSNSRQWVSCWLCSRLFHSDCVPASINHGIFYCKLCLLDIFPYNMDIFPYNHTGVDLEFRMAAKGLPYLSNFDYYRIQSDAYALNKMPQWIGQDSD